MQKVAIISVFVLTVVAFIYFSKPSEDYYQEMIVKRNNPGNIRNDGVNHWQGSDWMTAPLESFLTFDTLVHGYRAMIKDLHTKVANGFNTIEKIIYRYAPPSDNNPTENYVNFVADKVSILRTTPLSADNWKLLGDIAFYMSLFETGNQNNVTIQNDLLASVNSALDTLT